MILADELVINAHLADLVNDKNGALHVGAAHHLVQKGGFAASQKSGKYLQGN